ncbi:hypothetical protein A7K93_02210 [Candidatus Methylacidiphilum fumarolicum]|nr:hypothetical protein A7K73_00995 [Candidatus Methylacidiphilum fumarolicum]TFE73565.1 hypothetical protein A7K72_06635 [Candidatus Methylacidiphilum fumarolicum]TFE74974.1 hypothetical protein A7K93_02210 [Candidatus Methylacidiphilum fumarolicum]TFE76515.1 hypothetical protein A7D33_09215 [Candidatus Methylacidiphilum fumarolicum]
MGDSFVDTAEPAPYNSIGVTTANRPIGILMRGNFPRRRTLGTGIMSVVMDTARCRLQPAPSENETVLAIPGHLGPKPCQKNEFGSGVSKS